MIIFLFETIESKRYFSTGNMIVYEKIVVDYTVNINKLVLSCNERSLNHEQMRIHLARVTELILDVIITVVNGKVYSSLARTDTVDRQRQNVG
jgi:hypothetical protein